MLNRYLLSGCFIGSAMVMVASPAIAKQALTPKDVASIAKSTVVQIAPTVNYPGSGVIVGNYKEDGKIVYVVLTANHVVEHPDDEYKVITPVPMAGDRRRQKISISTEQDIQRLPGVDLAIVKFRSEHKFNTATLGNSDHTTEGAGVYVSGFPNPGQAITRRVFQFTSSLVSSRLDGDTVAGEEDTGVDDGYAISYTATTRAGMSGGPVFDVSGRVVGIHGRGDRDEMPKLAASSQGSQESGPQRVPDKTGFNLAIPIQTFLRKLAPSAIYKLGMTFDKSEPGTAQLYATRGRPVTNIIEEEAADAVTEVVNKSPKNSTPSRPVPTQVKPARTLPIQPTPSKNTTPTPPVTPLW
ncbi:serine protease [Anabaena sp. UHCC 0204]|uniref:S1 family peptidase n=1 Tax=Anabaena sp. UHCC 0204 TaxID=2590009 RepID=UPI001447E151|nr:serine protease [Anabaena sp. UHCC 0204]MTJ06556.1 trypsin-like peptidase domain-containing protein [Anabaena sp. UHCC 0204]